MKMVNVEKLKDDFYKLLDAKIGEEIILKKLSKLESNSHYLDSWYAFSKVGEAVYPSQGLLTTPFDYLHFSSLQMLPQETIIETLRVRRFFLELFNQFKHARISILLQLVSSVHKIIKVNSFHYKKIKLNQ